MSIDMLEVKLKATLIDKTGLHKNTYVKISMEEPNIIRFNVKEHVQLFLDLLPTYKALKVLTNNMEINDE